MRPQKKSCVVFLGMLGVVVVLGGCHKKQPPAPAPVKEAPPPSSPSAPQVNLTAEPATVDKGSSVTLSWTSQNATDLDLEPGAGKVQASGSTTVTPDESTTYVLTAKGPGGTETASARVTVTASEPPPPPPQPTVKGNDVQEAESELKDAYFDLDKSDIGAEAQQVLTGDANVLKQFSSVSVQIEGHCDERGSEEYNLGLGDRRASAAKTFMVNLGIPADRMTPITFGKDRPQCADHSEDCWQKNRRAHFAVK